MRQGRSPPDRICPQAREALRQLVARREPLYARAGVTVDTSGVTVQQAVDRAERAVSK